MAAAIQWFDPDAFAFVRKSDAGQLFAALGRALERRAHHQQNRRLVWELQTINEIASGIARSLELTDILTGALQRLVRAMDGAAHRSACATASPIGSRNAPRSARMPSHSLWTRTCPASRGPATRDCDARGRHRRGLRRAVGGDADRLPLRSALSVPMMAGDELLGTLSIGSTRPRRFAVADQQLLGLIAAQIVVAVQNAQLHHTIRRPSASGSGPSTRSAIRSRSSTIAANCCAATARSPTHLDLPITGITPPELRPGRILRLLLRPPSPRVRCTAR